MSTKLNTQAEGNQKPVSVGAYPEEIERWKQKAKAEGRPLSQWLRRRLVEADARDEEMAARASERNDG